VATNRNQQGQANPARIYDYLLGGTLSTSAERAAGDRLMRAKPDLQANVQANRRLLVRIVRYMSGQGISQFLDIGTGLPTMNNTHEVAQTANPAARIVYVDNDPLVVTTARALLMSSPGGVVDYLQADLRYPRIILNRARDTLDFSQPLAIMVLGTLYMIPDSQQPWDIVSALAGALPAGGYLAISHPASDIHAEESAAGADVYERATGIPQTNRTREEITRFFDGLSLVGPGVVPLNQWRPDEQEDPAISISSWAGLGFRQ